MDDLQCLVSGINDGIFGDVINRLLNNNNIKVYECSSDVHELKNAVNDDIAYLLIGMNNKQLPSEYKELLNVNSHLIIIEVFNDGESICLYMDDISELILNKIVNLNERMER